MEAMDKITMTEFGKNYLFDKTNTERPSLFPAISAKSGKAQQVNDEKSRKSLFKYQGRGLDVASLRNLLKDSTFDQLTHAKSQTEHQAFKYIKKELLRDIPFQNDFFNHKAEAIAKKIMAISENWHSDKNLPMEIGKGRNYLTKIIKEYESRQEGDTKVRQIIAQRMRGNV